MTANQLSERAMSASRASEKRLKAKWTEIEDRLLTDAVGVFGTNNWYMVSLRVPHRTGKQCRERWMGQLNPDFSRRLWTAEEDTTLVRAQRFIGNRWSTVAKLLGRPAICVKNRWHWLMRHSTNYQSSITAVSKSDASNRHIFSPLEVEDEGVFGLEFEEFRRSLSFPPPTQLISA